MPKPSQSVATSESSMRFELKDFIKKGFHKVGIRYGSTIWNNNSSIAYSIVINEDEKYFRLEYTQTDCYGNKTDMDYKIYLTSIKSNLGKGNVYYFLCSVTNRKCRVLYLVYGSQYFKSRYAYQN